MKNNFEFPNTLFPLEGGDKSFQENWYKGRNLLNFPASYRILLTGGVNSGKTHSVKHIILRAKPHFEKIYLLHFDESSKDYEGIEIEEEFKDVPDPLFFSNDKQTKKLLIVEDVCFTQLNKEQRKKYNRLLGYTSSHCNLSICINNQNMIDVPASIRRMCNIFVLFRTEDMNLLGIIAKRVGISTKDLFYIFENFITEPHDSLWIDLTRGTPCKLRINGFHRLVKVKNGKSFSYEIEN